MKKYTQEELNNFEIAGGYRQCPSEKVVKSSKIFEEYMEFVAKNVDIDGLDVVCSGGEPEYEDVEVTMEFETVGGLDYNTFRYGVLRFECEHDEKMNYCVRLSKYKDEDWGIRFDTDCDIRNIKYWNEFEIMLKNMDRSGVKIEMDEKSESESVTPEEEPEASYS